MQTDVLKAFIKSNAPFIYEYINQEVLKDVGVMDPNFFIKVIKEIFEENNEFNLSETNLLPYYLFTLFSQRGIIAYTSLRAETLNFAQIDKEASTYYNYARFTLNDEVLSIQLMQAKIGGMPIDADIVKFKKDIPIKVKGLELFMRENKELTSKEAYLKIQKEISQILS